jgi:hypothetical protein
MTCRLTGLALACSILVDARPLSAGQAAGELTVETFSFDCARGGPGVKVASDGKPVAGAPVHFSLPDLGTGVSFPGGRKTLETTTDASGIAVATELRRTGETSAPEFPLGAAVTWQGRQAAAVIPLSLESKHLCLTVLSCEGFKNRATRECCAPGLVVTDQYGEAVRDATVTFQFRSCQTKDGRDSAPVQTDPEGKAQSPPLVATGRTGRFEMIATASKSPASPATAKIGQEIAPVGMSSGAKAGIIAAIAAGAAGGALAAMSGSKGGGGGSSQPPTTTPPPSTVTVTFGSPTFGPPR